MTDTPPPATDEREAVARPSKFGKYSDYWNALCRSAPNRKWSIAQEREHAFDAGFDAALSALAPYRAREIAAAEARGLERARDVVADCRNSAASEPARSDDWQDGVLTGMDTVGFAIFAEINAIERREHDTGKEG